MLEQYLVIDHHSELSLQEQLRAGITHAISQGYLPLSKSLPSSRKLSASLKVARNTVVRVYELLLEEGVLVSRARSGYFINPEFVVPPPAEPQAQIADQRQPLEWQRRFRGRLPESTAETLAASAQDTRPGPALSRTPDTAPEYRFVYGQPDLDVFPVNEWRQCSLRVLNRKSSASWAADSASDAELVEQIRSRILPRRGIFVSRDEVLLTIGTQHSLYILAQLLSDAQSRIGMEDPGYPEARNIFSQRGCQLVSLPVDSQGLILDQRLRGCDLVYTTPSHQFPTTVTLSPARRRLLLERAEADDFLIIEDDYEQETNFIRQPVPALKAESRSERVIYLSSLSRVLVPGLRIGIMVAAPELIRQAKALRSLMIRQPPANNLSTLSLFLTLGHYDTLMQKLIAGYRKKWHEMEDSLNYYMPQTGASLSYGGTAFWIQGPPQLDAARLCEVAREQGILISPGGPCYAQAQQSNCFRLSFASIPLEQIRDGVAELARVMQQLLPPEHLEQAVGERVRGDALRRLLLESQIQSSDCFHVDFTLTFEPDGRMDGISHHQDDTDSGWWWIEDDRWCRRWQRWQFAEERHFAVVRHGQLFKWFDEAGLCVNQGVLRPRNGASSGSGFRSHSR